MNLKRGCIVLSLSITISSIFLFSCDESDPITNDQTPPIVPPKSTMQIDFNIFPDTTSPARIQKPQLTRSNWGWAALNVAIWNSLLTLTLAIPVAAFGESFNHQPVLQDDGSWLWEYTVVVDGINHTVKLYGKSVTEGAEWRMLLTKEGQYSDFEWVTGFSNLPATSGTWTLNYSPNAPNPFLFIEWNRNPAEGTGDIKFTNIVPEVAENGGYIYGEVTNDTPYNAIYHIYNAGEDNLIEIEWHRTNKEGRVKDAIHFQTMEWNCWNTNLMDIDCP